MTQPKGHFEVLLDIGVGPWNINEVQPAELDGWRPAEVLRLTDVSACVWHFIVVLSFQKVHRWGGRLAVFIPLVVLALILLAFVPATGFLLGLLRGLLPFLLLGLIRLLGYLHIVVIGAS